MSRWQGQPRRLRVAVAELVMVLLHGTAAHVAQLVMAGGAPCSGLPSWLRAYFGSLTTLDPLAARLLLRRCRAGWC